MAKLRQILLVKTADSSQNGDDFDERPAQTVADIVPLGTVSEVIDALRDFNTAPDGTPESAHVLYGPGFIAQLPMVGARDPVGQILLSVSEEDSAWPVLANICARLRWKLMDPSSGRMFG